MYTVVPFYAFTVTATKLSLLCLYRRIFISKRFQQVSSIIRGLCVIWWLVFTIVALIPCRPVRKAWLPQLPGHCYNASIFILSANILDLVFDLSVLVLPIKPILNLQMSQSRKTLLCAIFLVGGL